MNTLYYCREYLCISDILFIPDFDKDSKENNLFIIQVLCNLLFLPLVASRIAYEYSSVVLKLPEIITSVAPIFFKPATASSFLTIATVLTPKNLYVNKVTVLNISLVNI